MKLIKEINENESGQTFILVLIMLLLGGLIIASLLGYMSTGLNVGRVYEERMAELYAADSGVEDALWQIKTVPDDLPQTEGASWTYSITDVNDKEVNPVIITYVDEEEEIYKIESTATNTETLSSTTIVAHASILDFDFFLDNAITSRGTVDLKSEGAKKAMVYDGDVIYCTGDPPSEEQVIAGPLGKDGKVINECVDWPTCESISGHYRDQVTALPDAGDTWDLKDNPDISPLYRRDGDLNIYSTSNNLTGVLEGTIYVTGDLLIGQQKQDFTLKLSDHNDKPQTIFVKGEIKIGGKCTITGSGCIIACGDILFLPKISSSVYDFVFVMSINGTTTFNPGAPSSDFYGSLAGNVDVQLQPGKSLTWTEYPEDLNLPGFGDQHNVISAIRTWEISLA